MHQRAGTNGVTRQVTNPGALLLGSAKHAVHDVSVHHGSSTPCASLHGHTKRQHAITAGSLQACMSLHSSRALACMENSCSNSSQTQLPAKGCNQAARAACPMPSAPATGCGPRTVACAAAGSATEAVVQPAGELGPALQAGMLVGNAAAGGAECEPTYLGSVFVVLESSDEDNLPQNRDDLGWGDAGEQGKVLQLREGGPSNRSRMPGAPAFEAWSLTESETGKRLSLLKPSLSRLLGPLLRSKKLVVHGLPAPGPNALPQSKLVELHLFSSCPETCDTVMCAFEAQGLPLVHAAPAPMPLDQITNALAVARSAAVKVPAASQISAASSATSSPDAARKPVVSAGTPSLLLQLLQHQGMSLGLELDPSGSGGSCGSCARAATCTTPSLCFPTAFDQLQGSDAAVNHVAHATASATSAYSSSSCAPAGSCSPSPATGGCSPAAATGISTPIGCSAILPAAGTSNSIAAPIGCPAICGATATAAAPSQAADHSSPTPNTSCFLLPYCLPALMPEAPEVAAASAPAAALQPVSSHPVSSQAAASLAAGSRTGQTRPGSSRPHQEADQSAGPAADGPGGESWFRQRHGWAFQRMAQRASAPGAMTSAGTLVNGSSALSALPLPWSALTLPADLTFGVELELLVDRVISHDEVFHRLGAQGLVDWGIRNDFTIKGGPGSTGVEIVSPVLQGLDGLAQIYRLQSTLSTLPISFNTSTGLHVHVGYTKGRWPIQQLRAISLMFCDLEPGFDQLVPADRRGSANRFCASLVLPNPKEHEEDPRSGAPTPNRSTEAVVPSCTPEQQGPRCPSADAPPDVRAAACAACTTNDLANAVNKVDRRYKLNLRSLEKHGTLEFRHPAATASANEICGFTVMYLMLVEAAGVYMTCCGDECGGSSCSGAGSRVGSSSGDSSSSGSSSSTAGMVPIGIAHTAAAAPTQPCSHHLSPPRLNLEALSHPKPTSVSQLPPDIAARLSNLPTATAMELATLAMLYQPVPCVVAWMVQQAHNMLPGPEANPPQGSNAPLAFGPALPSRWDGA